MPHVAAVCASISIHALREEGDPSTSCVRRFRFNFYPRPPRGGRHSGTHRPSLKKEISIHALREEGDLANIGEQAILNKISIHALREEGDQRTAYSEHSLDDFYPRPPRGGRQSLLATASFCCSFLSTPSARRATKYFLGQSQQAQDFYPRPPRGGRPSR